MARQGITRDQVYETAATLRDEGVQPTVQAVRERLGSGSFSTISAHLAEWKTEHGAQAVADIPAMPDKVQAAFQQIWATTARSAQEGLETQRQALEAMRREMDKERSEMAGEIKRLEKALEETATRANALETALSAEREAGQEKDQQLTSLRIENARLDERAKAAEERAAEHKNQLEGLQEKFTELAKTRKGAARKKDPHP